MKKTHRILIASFLLSGLALFGGCGSGNETQETLPATEKPDIPVVTETPPESLPETETTVPELRVGMPLTYDVVHKKVYNAALDWSGSSETVPGTTEKMYWLLSGARKLQANLINVFPQYKENGTTVSGARMVNKNYLKILENNAAALNATQKAGMEVIDSLPMCLMTKEAFRKYNDDYKKYAAVKPDGSVAENDDTAYACINNPLFQEMVRGYTVAAAEAGWDGMFFDANPYAYGAKYNCCCQYCKADWAEFSAEQTGAAIPLLTSDPKLVNENDRLFWKWRYDIYTDFLLDMQAECRKYNPDFSLWPNTGFNGVMTVYYALKGITDGMLEYGANTVVNPGEESTLYAFAQHEALVPEKQLITQFNNISTQASPDYKWYTAYAEAIAGGGSLMAPTTSKGTSTFFSFINGANTIKKNDPEAFSDSASAADVAIVYSWQNINAFTFKSAGTISFAANSPRKAAALLAAQGIPFDYVMPENTADVAKLYKYRTVILPELKLIDDTFESVLYEYVQKGGRLLVLGACGTNTVETYGVTYPARETDVLEKWTGTSYAKTQTGACVNVGKGMIYVVKSYITGASDAAAKPTAAFTKAVADLGLCDLVNVTEPQTGKVETVLRSDATGSRWWLHVITYATQGQYADTPLTVTVRIPEGQKVTAVTGVSPTVTAAKMNLSWEQKDDRLTITAQTGLWSMIRIEKQ